MLSYNLGLFFIVIFKDCLLFNYFINENALICNNLLSTAEEYFLYFLNDWSAKNSPISNIQLSFYIIIFHYSLKKRSY